MKIQNIHSYADVIAYVRKLKTISYNQYGSYQGDYIAVLHDEQKIYFYKGCYGSCSGCDELEDWISEDYEVDSVEEQHMVDYMKDFCPFLEIPFEKMSSILDGDGIRQLLPANTRVEYKGRPQNKDDIRDRDQPYLEDVEDLIREVLSTHHNTHD